MGPFKRILSETEFMNSQKSFSFVSGIFCRLSIRYHAKRERYEIKNNLLATSLTQWCAGRRCAQSTTGYPIPMHDNSATTTGNKDKPIILFYREGQWYFMTKTQPLRLLPGSSANVSGDGVTVLNQQWPSQNLGPAWFRSVWRSADQDRGR